MTGNGGPPGPPRRPGPGRWLWYAVSGRLAWRYRDWVLYDLTTSTWPLRHLARLLVPLVPVAAVLVTALPGPLSLRVTAVVFGSVIGLGYTFVFLDDSTDRRAARFGYPSGTTEAVRKRRARARRSARRPDGSG